MKKILFVDYDEVGAFLFSYANIINKQNSELVVYYTSFGGLTRLHNSNKFHFGHSKRSWDYTLEVEEDSNGNRIDSLEEKVENLRKLMSTLKPDIVFTSGRGAYLCYKASVKYIYWAYGSDIEQQAFGLACYTDPPKNHEFVLNYVNNRVDSEAENAFTQSLRDNIWRIGIQNADAYVMLPRSLGHLKKIRKNPKLVFIPHLPAIDKDSSSLELSSCVKDKAGGIIFFSSTRHCFGDNWRFITDNKGNDIFIKAVDMYRKKTGGANFMIHLIDKGPDVDKMKSMLKKLNLDENTKWFPEMKRSELIDHYKKATICFGQFATQALEYSAIEPMSLGIPTVSWYGNVNEYPFNEALFYDEPAPVLDSKDPDKISNYMLDILNDKHKYHDVCHDSYRWCKDNCSADNIVKAFLKLAENSAK